MKILGWFTVLLAVFFLVVPALMAEEDIITPPIKGYVTELGPDCLVIVDLRGKKVELPNITNLENLRSFLALAMKNRQLICLLAKFSRESYTNFHVEISTCN